MAQQYNPKRVLRQISNPLLKEFFEGQGHPLEVNWDNLGPRKVEPLFEQFHKIPENERRRIEITFHDAHDLAAGDWIKVIIEEAARQGEDLIPLLLPMESRYDKALWTCMNRPRVWEAAVRFAKADSLARYWDRRGDIPQLEPKTGEAALRQLEDAVSAFFMQQQGRGQRCKVEHFPRGEQDYFFIYLSDYPSTYESWDDRDNLVPHIERRAFEVVVSYDRTAGTLDMYAKGGKKVREPLQEIFSRVILGKDLQPEDGSKRIFDLGGLLRRDFPFDYDPADGIRGVSIWAMRVSVLGNPRKKINIEVNPDDGPQAIYDSLEHDLDKENLPMSVLRPDYVKLHFELDNNGQGRSMTFEVRPKSCTLKSKREEQRLLGEKYLGKWGIDVSGQS